MPTANFGLLNTRPAHQAENLSQLVVTAGGESFSCPTIHIDWLAASQKVVAKADSLIFISANAVEGFFRLAPSASLTDKKLYAIGTATANKLQQKELEVECPAGQQFDSESLLQQMRSVAGQNIVLVKGHGGRDKLLQTLTERGATVTELDVYQRQAEAFCPQAWLSFRASDNPMILATSVESLQNLIQNVPQEEQVWLFQQTLIVFSQRISDAAKEFGWSGVIAVVPTQSDDGVLRAINETLEDFRRSENE